MPTRKGPRKGSLQFWPRKRVRKFLPRVNWNAISKDASGTLKGFICYKAGMISGSVKDNTANSMTKGKKIVVPMTVLECPPMKIFSVRFYKQGDVVKDVLVKNLDKELKRKVKLPKKESGDIASVKQEYDDVKIIAYSIVKKLDIKKTPDLSEIGLYGTLEQKMNFIKDHLNKEIVISDVFKKGNLVDLRGLTTGKGFQGPVKRFGVTLRSHKSEKGVRGPGAHGSFHPRRITFRVPEAGQMGTFTRIVYNSKIFDLGNAKDKAELKGFKRFGDVKGDYILVNGSVQGPPKRQVIATRAIRETKLQLKKEYEFLKIIR